MPVGGIGMSLHGSEMYETHNERLLFIWKKGESDGSDKANESGNMIPMKLFAGKKEHSQNRENRKGNNFLNNF